MDRTPSCRIKIDSRPKEVTFGQNGTTFRQKVITFEQNGPTFGQNEVTFGQKVITFGQNGITLRQKEVSPLPEGVPTDSNTNNSNQGTITINVLSGSDSRETSLALIVLV